MIKKKRVKREGVKGKIHPLLRGTQKEGEQGSFRGKGASFCTVTLLTLYLL